MLRSARRLLLVTAVLFIAGCDQGPVGPPGPPGPPGDPAVYSFTVDFFMADAQFNGPIASVQYDAPEISPRVVNNGAVMAYFREQDTWTALPYTYGVESADLPAVDRTVTLGFAYEVDFFEVFYEASRPEVLDMLPDQLIKVVIIDSFAGARAAGVDLTDYAEVKAHYGLDN